MINVLILIKELIQRGLSTAPTRQKRRRVMMGQQRIILEVGEIFFGFGQIFSFLLVCRSYHHVSLEPSPEFIVSSVLNPVITISSHCKCHYSRSLRINISLLLKIKFVSSVDMKHQTSLFDYPTFSLFVEQIKKIASLRST